MRRLIVSLSVMTALVVGWMLWQRGCDRTRADISIDGGAILVRNQTKEDWKNVRIWVNDYYSGTASEIRAGSFVREPVTRFVAAQGQKLQSTTPITSVVVLATSASGTPVRIPWGKPAWY
jgi:hypothetical protein